MRYKLPLLALGVCLALSSCTRRPELYHNPILSGMNPDPTICRVGDDFYLATSTFEYFPGIPIYHSRDLVNWKMIGHALATEKNNPLMGCSSSNGGQYAPTLRYNDGTFYLIGTNYGGNGSQGVSYVTAKDPAGPWSDPIWVGNWYVDPSIEFIDGTMYYLTPDNKGSFMLGTMNPETGEFIEPLRIVASGLGGSSPEGPHFYKIGDYYYIMSAEGGTGYEHREVIQRSKSPWGPYEPSPLNPVLSNMNHPELAIQAAGHADLVQIQDGSWWIVCLGIRPVDGHFQHLGRETFLSPVTWTDGWPKVGEDGLVLESFPSPSLKPCPWEAEPARDEFDSPELALKWTFIRNPREFWSLSERPGYLRIKGPAGNFEGFGSPSFIGCRQSAFDMRLSSSLEFVPTSDNEEAGLVVRANDSNHYDLMVTLRDGSRAVILRKILCGEVTEECVRAVPEDGPVTLSISSTARSYSFSATCGSGEYELGSADSRDLSNEKLGGFTGVFIGMYASGNGKENTNPADYGWFESVVSE